jgi:hypothetical protein
VSEDVDNVGSFTGKIGHIENTIEGSTFFGRGSGAVNCSPPPPLNVFWLSSGIRARWGRGRAAMGRISDANLFNIVDLRLDPIHLRLKLCQLVIKSLNFA